MFDKTRNQMAQSRCDNPHAFWDLVNHSIQPTTSFGIVKRTGKRFSSCHSDDLRAKIEPSSCQ
jgi:hypothetical protein